MSANLVAPTAAWESRITPGALPARGVLVQSDDGGWELDDSLGLVAEAYAEVAADGGVQANDAAASGLRLAKADGQAVAY